jgi:hypothetical protein
MALTMLSIPLGVVLFVILVVAVAAWWVAAISGLGLICLASLIDLAIQSNRAGEGKASSAYS